jgi:ribosomal protein L24E
MEGHVLVRCKVCSVVVSSYYLGRCAQCGKKLGNKTIMNLCHPERFCSSKCAKEWRESRYGPDNLRGVKKLKELMVKVN